MNLPVRRDEKPPEALPRIGLALGGGGARGLAHVVILEALDEMGVKPAVIAGTSIGALLGSSYAAGLSGAHLRALVEETLGSRFDMIRQLFGARTQPLQQFLRLLPLRSALLDPEALLDVVLPAQFPNDFGDLQIPFRAIATDLASHEVVAYSVGDVRRAVAASIAIPVLFSPVEIDGRYMADGGLANPLPIDTIAGAADILIAIDVSGGKGEADIGARPSVTTVLVQSIQILQKTIIRERLRLAQPDLYFDFDLDAYGALQFHRAREILAAAEPAKDDFKRKVERLLAHPKLAIDRSD